MGLYLCVFSGQVELDGVEVGSYADFHLLRDAVNRRFAAAAKSLPILMTHSDSDGQWTAAEAAGLRVELERVAAAFKREPAEGFHSDWQREIAKSMGLRPQSFYDTFVDVDGEPLLERLRELCELSVRCGEPILFQ